jgi:ribosomal protein L21
VLDFNARNKEQAYLDTVPPKVKEAIQAHHVLVGMNQEMVLHAKGKPPKKVRERDGETQYEEWIYGEPPADVDFVRMVGDEVVRVETMKVGGEKIVRTEKEVILPSEIRTKTKKRRKNSRKRSGETRRVCGVRAKIHKTCPSRLQCWPLHAAAAHAAARLAAASGRPGGSFRLDNCAAQYIRVQNGLPRGSNVIAWRLSPTSANENASETLGYSCPSTST